jgi:Tfp pilus assembly protein PilX
VVNACVQWRGLVKRRSRGAALVVGLILLGLVTLLGLAGAGTAQVERRLAHNERFRENAGAAASAGIELAIGNILAAAVPAEVPARAEGFMPDSQDRYITTTRFSGLELALPQLEGGLLAAAHFEIVSTGYSSRRAIDRQRITVMRVVESRDAAPMPCGTSVATRCFRVDEWARMSWQRIPAE